MTTISRRTLIGAMAAIPAAAAPGRRARSAPEADESGRPSLLSPAELARYHLDAYKAAAQLADPSITGWYRVVPEDDVGFAFALYADRRPIRDEKAVQA